MKEKKTTVSLFIVFVSLNKDGWKEKVIEREAVENKLTYSYENEFGKRFIKKEELMWAKTAAKAMYEVYAEKCYCLEADLEKAKTKLKNNIINEFNYYFKDHNYSILFKILFLL